MGLIAFLINVGGTYLMYIGARTLWRNRKARKLEAQALRDRSAYLEQELRNRPIDGGLLISENRD